MKVLLDIEESKSAFILELLGYFKFVKVQPLTTYKTEVLDELKTAVEEVNQVKYSKKNTQSLNDFLDEL